MSNIYKVKSVVNISFSGKVLLAGSPNEIEVKSNKDGESFAALLQQNKLLNLGDDMVVLKIPVKAKEGELLAGTRIDGVLPDETVAELIKNGSAVESKGLSKPYHQDQQDGGEGETGEKSDEQDQSDDKGDADKSDEAESQDQQDGDEVEIESLKDLPSADSQKKPQRGRPAKRGGK